MLPRQLQGEYESISRGARGALPPRYNEFEQSSHGSFSGNMIGDYIWGLKRENDMLYSRKKKKQKKHLIQKISFRSSKINLSLDFFCFLSKNGKNIEI